MFALTLKGRKCCPILKSKQSLFMRLPFRRQPRPRAGGPLVRAARPVVGQLLRGVAQGDRGAGGGERAEPDPAAPRSLGPERGARGGDRGRRMGECGGGRASLRGPPPQQPTPAPAAPAKAEAVSRPPPVRRQGRPPRSSPGTLCYKVRLLVPEYVLQYAVRSALDDTPRDSSWVCNIKSAKYFRS